MLVRLLCTLAVLGCCVENASAAINIYTNRADFLAAAGGGLAFESFEDSAQTGAMVTYGPLDFEELNGINFFTHTSVNSGFGGLVTDGQHAIWYDDNTNSTSTLTVNTVPASSAIGLDIAVSRTSTVAISGPANIELNLFGGVSQFFGVINTDGAVGQITFDVSGAPLVGFDSVHYGQDNVTILPEPTSLAMFGIGAIGLGAFVRRRKS